jgi:UDP-N-acetylglucosamine pyrophosphorylase
MLIPLINSLDKNGGYRRRFTMIKINYDGDIYTFDKNSIAIFYFKNFIPWDLFDLYRFYFFILKNSTM